MVRSFIFLICCVSFVLAEGKELKKAPSFSTRDLQGKLIDSKKLYSNKMTMVFFWHSCCGIDKQQLALLKEFYQKHKSDGLEIIGVAVDGVKKSALVKKAVKKYSMNWVSVVDKSNAIKSKFKPILLPTLYLINDNGEILDYYSSYRSEYEGQQRSFVAAAFE